MQYERYHGKISRLKQILDTVRRFRVLILSVVGVCLALTSGFLGAQGYVYEDVPCPDSIVYGDELPYRASALFRDAIRYEYAEDSAFTTVLDDLPRYPGAYFVRAVSTSSFGTPRYGEVYGFTVLPRELDVYVAGSTLPYGDSPTVTAETVYGDSISCDAFVYGDPTQKKTAVTPVTEGIRVTDAQGNDVTYAYTLKPLPCEIEFIPREITVTVSDAENTYNGLPFTFDGYELSAGTLATHTDGSEDRLIATFKDSITDVGSAENVPEIKVIGFDQLDVTANYAITLVAGELTVNKYPVQIHVSDAELEYTGAEQNYREFTVSENTPLIEGHTASVTDSTGVTESGRVENLLLFDIYDDSGQNMSENYSVFVSESFITVQRRAITVTTSDGHWVYDGESHGSNAFTVTSDKQIADGETAAAEGGTRITSVAESGAENIFTVSLKASDGRDVTHNYEISYVYGKLTLEPKPIRYASESAELEYNGLARTHGGFTLAADTALAPGHTAFVSHKTEITNVSEGEVENRLTLLVRDGEGGDQTANYVLEQTAAGLLRIIPRPITVTANDAQRTYDGTPLTGRSVSVDGLAEGHTLTADLLGSRTEVGSSVVTVDEASVSIVNGEDAVDLANYTLSFAAGTLTVTKRPVTVLSAEDTWTYDGTAHSNGTVTALNLVEGHAAQVESLTEIVNVWDGPADNVVSVTVRGADGEDLSENYHIAYQYGKLTVTPMPITVISEGHDWVYDGAPHSWNGHAVSDATPLVEGHRTEALSLTEIVSIRDGSAETPAQNKITVTVLASDDTDMTANYALTYEYGELFITPRPVTVISESRSWTYDGSAHGWKGHAVSTETPLVEGHKTNVSSYATVTNVWDGSAETPALNEIAVTVLASDNEDMSDNYTITYEYGELIIIPRSVTVISDSHIFTYNGQAQFWEGHTVSGDTPLVSGHKTVAISHTEVTNVRDCPVGNPIPNKIEVEIRNASDKDMTANYYILYVYGELAMKPLPITVVTEGAAFTYNGQAQFRDGHTVSEETPLVDGHVTKVENRFCVTNVWDCPAENQLTVRIFDARDEDMTENYLIHYAYGVLTMDPLPITIITESQRWTYDGEAHSWDGHAVSEETPLVEGHVTKAYNLTWITNVWDGPMDNEFAVWVLDASGGNMTPNYEIRYVCGELVILPKPITAISEGMEWIYDGDAHSWEGYSFAEENALIPNHTVEIIENTTVTNVADSGRRNVLRFRIWCEDIEQTANYEITYRDEGILTVLPRPIRVLTGSGRWEYDGKPHCNPTAVTFGENGLVLDHRLVALEPYTHITEVRESLSEPKPNVLTVVILNEAGEDCTENYEILEYAYGGLEIYKRKITLAAKDATKEYDGTPLTCDEYVTFREDGAAALVLDHQIDRTDLIITGSVTDVLSEKTPNIPTGVARVVTKDGRDVTENYDITFENGELWITPRKIVITAGSDSKVYDATPLTCDRFTVTRTDPTEIALVLNHQIMAGTVVTEGSITNVGKVPNVIANASSDPARIYDPDTGRDVTFNYEVTYCDGELEIIPRRIIITTSTAEKEYDGIPLTCPTYELRGDGGMEPLVSDHILDEGSFAITGSITDPGQTDNTLEGDIQILSAGVPVTENYEIIREEGKLTVMPASPEDDDGGGSGGSGEGDGEGDGEGGGGSGGGGGGDIDASGNIGGGPLGGDNGEEEPPVALKLWSTTSGPIYLRYTSFGNFTGQGFGSAPVYGGLLDERYAYTYLAGIAMQNAGLSSDIIKVALNTNQLFLPYYMLTGEYGYDIQGDDVIYTGDLQEFWLKYYAYTGSGKNLVGNLGDYADEEAAYREFVYQSYLDLYDHETAAYMNGIIAANGFRADDPLIIEKVARFIQESAVYDLKYDRTLDEAPNIAIAFLEEYKTGICQHYAMAATLLYRALGIPARYTIGYTAHTSANEWVEVTTENAHAWVEVYVDGVGWIYSEVTGSGGGGGGNGGNGGGNEDMPKNPLIIRPVDVEEEYDGSPHYALPELYVEFGSLLEMLLSQGFTYEVTVDGCQTEIGETPATITSFVLRDPNGRDVTDQYDVIFEAGVIRVTREQVVINLFELQKFYDGTELRYAPNDFWISKPAGVTVLLDLSGCAITDAGVLDTEELRKLPVTILDADGNDVTELYYVKFVGEPLRIDKRAITLRSASETKTYDGTPLTNDTVSLVFGELVEGHRLEAHAIGSVTFEGFAENTIDPATLRILDADGNDVTDNYQITCEAGILTVLS